MSPLPDAARALRSLGDGGRRANLESALAVQGSVDGAARMLGISKATAWRWMRELGIEPPRPRRIT